MGYKKRDTKGKIEKYNNIIFGISGYVICTPFIV